AARRHRLADVSRPHRLQRDRKALRHRLPRLFRRIAREAGRARSRRTGGNSRRFAGSAAPRPPDDAQRRHGLRRLPGRRTARALLAYGVSYSPGGGALARTNRPPSVSRNALNCCSNTAWLISLSAAATWSVRLA